VVYFGAVFWLTRSVNVPIKNELTTWNPAAPPAGWQQARDTWNEANLQRAVAAGLCFVGAVFLVALSGVGSIRMHVLAATPAARCSAVSASRRRYA
jgi:hypothetical protein